LECFDRSERLLKDEMQGMVASNNSFLESTVVGFRAYRLAYVIDISS
jgi:hypothetical protein